jgi:hypothetical protein
MLIDISLEGSKELKNRLKEFNLNTWCVSELYLFCLKRYDTGRFKKAIVNVIRGIEDNELIEDMIDVVLIYQTFDFEHFFVLEDKYAKKKMLLEVLHSGMMNLANKKGWSISPLEEAYKLCIKYNLEYKWLRQDKYLLSPNRSYYGGIFCNWDIDKFEVSAIFFNKNKEEIERIKFYENEPHDIELMGKMGWDNITNEFYLYSKNEKKKWIASPSVTLNTTN